MPRTVDHGQRRRQIAEAVWRLAATTGLEAVTLRRVAAEAGVSMRLVQYYFGTRQALLTRALEILNADSAAMATERLTPPEGAGEPEPRELLRGVLAELLPLDDRRRTRQLVHIAYFVRSLDDDELATTFRDAAPTLEQLVSTLLVAARAAAATGPALEPDPERDARDAEALVAMADGLATKLLLGQRGPDDALAVLDRQLDLLLGI